MPSYLTSVLLEFSEDPLSDATPTWVDVTGDYQTIEWWAGIDREGDEPTPGGATIRLRNTNRRWEPDYVAGEFYPNMTTGRRFRLTLNDGLGAVQQGVWYVTDIQIDYPGGKAYSEVTMTCSDGFEVLALDDLPLMDPPDADTYAAVIAHDQPLGHYPLDDAKGTQAVAVLRTVKRKGKKRRRLRRGERVAPTEVQAAAGNAGVYVDSSNLATWQRPSLILGDSGYSFRPNTASYATAAVERTAFYENNAVTAETWRKVNFGGALCAGPWNTASAANIFILETGSDGRFSVQFPTGRIDADRVSAAPSVGDVEHYVGTWDGTTVSLYINGVLEAATSASGRMLQGDANEFVYIVGAGHSQNTATDERDETAFYEHALTAERVLAHYEAGSARGWNQQTAGARIADIATHALWSEASIQTTGRDVQPEFKHGQAKLEEIAELAHAEGPRTMFFFNGTGDPVYLGHEWQAGSASYNTVQATFGDSGTEIRYQGFEPVYDNEVYNDVTVSHEAGELANATDTTSINDKGRRANTEYTDVLLMEHVHVESLAAAVLAFYKDPALRPATLTINGAGGRATHALRRDIGDLVRVKRRGEGGTPIDRVANIIGKRKRLVYGDGNHLTCQWMLGRGYNAADGFWHAGIVGDSEAGVTTVAA